METIRISGINRDPLNEDRGSCQEIINLRFKDGSLVPVGKKHIVVGNGLPNMAVVFIHSVDADTDQGGDPGTAGKNYLGYNSAQGKIVTWESSTPEDLTTIADIEQIGASKGTNISFTAVKNLVVIIDKVDKKLRYLLWKDGAYTFIGDKFPELLPLVISSEAVDYTSIYKSLSNESFKAAYGKQLASWRTTGFDEGLVLVRYAYEMFDGSIVGHSAPRIMTLSPTGEITKTSIHAPGECHIEMHGGKLNFTYQSTTNGDAILTSLNTAYKHLVKNIVIYMTKPVASNKIERMGFNISMNIEGFDPGLAGGTPFKEVINQEIFYKIHALSITDIVTGVTIAANPGDLTVYEGREIMPQDDMSHHNMSASANMVYNGRLILGDISTDLFNGYTPEELLTPHTGSADAVSEYYVDIYTTILTEEGEKKVKSSSKISYTKHQLQCALISYPDTRASKMEIVKRLRVDGTTTLLKTYLLSKNPNHNLSQYLIQQDLTPANIPTIFDPAIIIPFTPPVTLKNSFSDSNMVKMSALNNPMQFPSKNTYLVGLSKILGFNTNALPISQGQFGQFPILAFTDSGMWAMQLGQGGTVIETVVPLNEFICNNPGSITKVDKSILFSTNEGLILLQGAEDTLLSQPLRGTFGSPLLPNTEASAFLSHVDLVQLTDLVSDADFNTYLAESNIGYDSKNRELIVSNAKHGYSYVFSFTSKAWTKITEKFKYFITDFPNSYGVTSGNNNIVDLTIEDSIAVDTLIISRPINYNEFVKVLRLGLKASIDADDNKVTGFYLFGSVDGRLWSFVTGIQQKGNFNNPYVNRALMSFKEAIIILAGNFNSKTYLNEINIDLKVKYANKTIR